MQNIQSTNTCMPRNIWRAAALTIHYKKIRKMRPGAITTLWPNMRRRKHCLHQMKQLQFLKYFMPLHVTKVRKSFHRTKMVTKYSFSSTLTTQTRPWNAKLIYFGCPFYLLFLNPNINSLSRYDNLLRNFYYRELN